jgi:mono/diheme cytochrome c family protein/glucose/arabinose dehydrogenase
MPAARRTALRPLLAATLLALARLAGGAEDMPDPLPLSKVPPAPVVPAAQGVATMTVAPGFKVELVASEPMVDTPVAMAFDGDGRLWVVEMCGFMPDVNGTDEDKPIGKIVILEDTDGDGRMDKATTFMDGLVLPRAISLTQGGALIAEPPTVWFAKDTDGDGKADVKTQAFGGYGGRGNMEHTANGLLRGLDNWLYSANHVARYRLQDGKWLTEPSANRGQWGVSQDDIGRLYHNNNSDWLSGDAVPADWYGRNPALTALKGHSGGAGDQIIHNQGIWTGRMNPGVNRGYRKGQLRDDFRLATCTAACAPVVYRGAAMPDCIGDVFIGEPSGNTVRRAKVTDQDGKLTGVNVYDGQKKEFITSTDERFRPVNFAEGPDGALYIADLYHGVLQDKVFITPYLKRQSLARGLDKPLDLGRIYRVIPDKGWKQPARPALEKAAVPALVAHLGDDGGWWRDTAQRLLVEHGDQAAVPLLQALAVNAAAKPLGRMHALWTLEGLGAADAPTLAKALSDADPRVRTAAVRIAAALPAASRAPVIAPLATLAGDKDTQVRLALAASLGPIGDATSDGALLALVRAHADQPYLVDVALSGLAGRENALLSRIVSEAAWAGPAADRFVRGLGTSVAARGGKGSDLSNLLALAAASKGWQQEAILGGVVAARPKNASDGSLTLATAPAGWAGLSTAATGPVKGHVQAITAWMSWPGGTAAAKVEVSPPLTGAELTRFNAGKTRFLGLCAACHQPTGLGLANLAPPLVGSEWVDGSEQRLIRIALNGVRGPIPVDGQTFTGAVEMPALAATLDDTAIAEILTYIRHEWGHKAAPVETATVAAVRAELAKVKRNEAWTVEELNATEEKAK